MPNATGARRRNPGGTRLGLLWVLPTSGGQEVGEAWEPVDVPRKRMGVWVQRIGVRSLVVALGVLGWGGMGPAGGGVHGMEFRASVCEVAAPEAALPGVSVSEGWEFGVTLRGDTLLKNTVPDLPFHPLRLLLPTPARAQRPEEPRRAQDVLGERAPVSRAAPTSPVERCILRGTRLIAAGNPGSGLSWLRRAVSLAPRALAPQVALVDALWELGRSQEALALLERALEAHPSSPGLLRLRIRTSEGLARLGALRQLLSAEPRDEAAWLARAELSAALGAWNEALASRRRLRELARERGGDGMEHERWIEALERLALSPANRL